jgi:hypothetical protein
MAFPPEQFHRQRLANKPATKVYVLGMLLQTKFYYPKHSKINKNKKEYHCRPQLKPKLLEIEYYPTHRPNLAVWTLGPKVLSRVLMCGASLGELAKTGRQLSQDDDIV